MAQPVPRYPLQVEGREVLISNPDKVFYPETGMTKLEVIDYYIRISPALLPHLRDRPLSLKRYPHGVGVSYFYQKEAPEHRPDWIRTTPVWSGDRGADINYVVCDDLPTLVWLANAADLEMHTFMHTAKDLERPTQVAFDLDPGPGADARTCCSVALMLKDHFDALGLKAFAKVSGSKGVQLHVPLNTPVSYEETKVFSKALAVALQTEHPKLITALMKKDLRKDKVFIDWSQNDQHKTTVCVYSMRGVAVPSVATPIDWKEVEAAVDARDLKGLRFSPDQAVQRFKRKGDLFSAVETLKQRLPGAAEDEPEPKAKPAATSKAKSKARR